MYTIARARTKHMKNHFVFSYSGNKRQEVKRIYEAITCPGFGEGLPGLEGVETIVEPFAGSAAVSYYISTQHPLKFKYVLNDSDAKLCQLYELMKDPEALGAFEREINGLLSVPGFGKAEYLALIKAGGLAGWFIGQKVKSIRPGLFPLRWKYKPVNFAGCPIVGFMQSEAVEVICGDAVAVLSRFDADPSALIYLDPPYVSVCNEFYHDGRNLNIYKHLYYSRFVNSRIFITVERHWIVDIIFAAWHKVDQYEKQYETSKTKCQHVFYRIDTEATPPQIARDPPPS